jgi:hypothetical protein
MTIDWVAVATIAAPIIALLVAAWLDSRSTRLIAYYSHIAGIAGTVPGTTQAIHVNTHTVVLRNAGPAGGDERPPPPSHPALVQHLAPGATHCRDTS